MRSMTAFRAMTLIVGLLAPLVQGATGEQAKPDPWEPVRTLVGDWVGSAEGQAGAGTVRRYALARRISGMPEDKMAATLSDLSHETMKAARR